MVLVHTHTDYLYINNKQLRTLHTFTIITDTNFQGTHVNFKDVTDPVLLRL